MEQIEILSPAGDEKSFYSAINNGANAIYLGLQNFNARNKAQNFNIDNLEYFVNYAHSFSVKVYIVINTLIINEEIKELLNLVEKAIDKKVDAFIVQDLGVGYLLKNTFKNIVLHASTQMGIHSLSGAKTAEEMGFSRVVLSREVSKQDIIEIKNNTNLELEYFVHGALCVCFSGNCYLSSLKNNESGNRGRCLQPCRLKYSSKENSKSLKKGFLLSANDLCLIDKIKELKEIGILSLKIEGRLRRPSFVAYATKMYYLASNLTNEINASQRLLRLQNFKKLFNRGEYNTGFYLSGEPNKNTINTNFSSHFGVEVGKVISVKPFKDIYKILIKTNGYEIKKNDGLKCFFETDSQSLGVGNVEKGKNKNEYIIYSKTNLKEQSIVNLITDSEFENNLLKNTKKIKFSANFIAKKNEYAKLILTANNIKIEMRSKLLLEEAKSNSLSQTEIEENLQRTKDTIFELENLTCDVENVFMPKSFLNNLRRESIEKLQQQILLNYEKENLIEVKKDYSIYNKLFNQNVKNGEEEISNAEKFICFNEFTNLEEIKKQFSNDAKIVFSPCNFSYQNIKDYFDKISQNFNVGKFYINLPKVLRGEDYKIIEEIINKFNPNNLGIIANNISHLFFVKRGYEVVGGVYLNITNTATVKFFETLGITCFVKSFEHFSTLNKGLSFVGKVDNMTFCHCPFKTNYNYDSCSNCKYNNALSITSEDGKTYNIRRTKIKNCTFELVDNKIINQEKQNSQNVFIDLRN